MEGLEKGNQLQLFWQSPYWYASVKKDKSQLLFKLRIANKVGCMKIEDISHATEGLKKDNQHQFFVKKMGVIFGLDYKARKSKLYTEDGRSMTTFYYCSVNHQSG